MGSEFYGRTRRCGNFAARVGLISALLTLSWVLPGFHWLARRAAIVTQRGKE